MLILAGCAKDKQNNIASTPTTPTTMQPTPTIFSTALVTTTPTLVPTPTVTPTTDNITPISTITITPNVTSGEKLDEYLCGEKEEALFSFQIADQEITAAICISKLEPGYIVYRYGTKDKIELEYPQNKDETSWGDFTYSYYMRGGGADNEGVDLNYLIFDNSGYEYQIYEEYSATEDKTDVGIKVTNTETGEETDIKGNSDTIQGSLIPLRDNSKVNTYK